MDNLGTFVKRLKRLNIDIVLYSNYPWIYLHSVNGKIVKETFMGNHGFTIAFFPIRKDQKLSFTDIKYIFSIIRKYR